MEWHSINQLCDVIRTTSLAVNRYHRSGHLEKVYENALAHRLGKLGLAVEKQYPLVVHDEDGTQIGEYFADLFVEHKLIVELKACKLVADDHVAQLLGYLRSSGMKHGLLINFGAPKLFIKKFVLSKGPPRSGLNSLLLSLCASCASLWPFLT